MVGLSSERRLPPDLVRAFAERGVYVAAQLHTRGHATLGAMDRLA
jgi:hypothetical protein